MDYKKLYINGEWVDSLSDRLIEVENPANMEIIEAVPRGNEEDVARAVEAAKSSFPAWSKLSLDERIGYMERFVEELYKRLDLMGDIIYQELGCGQEFARNTHVLSYIKDMENFIEVARSYDFVEDYRGYKIVKEPVGVVGALTPWNYPLGQISKKICPALLAGNTVVLKPSQKTPLVAYHLTDALDEAGFPPGVFNMVTGKGREIGNVLAQHEDVDMISFTGSTDGGIEVAREGLRSVKKLALELGGKSPSLILEGADLDQALFVSLNSIYFNTGQSCSALSRLLAPRSMKEELERKIIERTERYRFGNPKDEEVVIGPLGSREQFDKVKYFIGKGLEEGAELLIGELPDQPEGGYYVGPTVFTEVDNRMEIAQEEIFGPVLSIIYYDSLEEAIELANDTKFGLSSAVFGKEEEALEVAKELRAGTVIVNDGERSHSAAFGGYKYSGLGREGGKWGLEEYLETKTVFIK